MLARIFSFLLLNDLARLYGHALHSLTHDLDVLDLVLEF